MDIIIDSTVLKDNYFLDTPRFQALFDYLKKTHSKFYIPEVVILETIKNYTKEINEYNNSASLLEATNNKLKLGLSNFKVAKRSAHSGYET